MILFSSKAIFFLKIFPYGFDRIHIWFYIKLKRKSNCGGLKDFKTNYKI
ncbi:hypothetical protein LSS_11135 [Leptospira santarosai serovar Shermani str. LT 821]|uniref:Uncharacterized protein n=1 Tax=Leptospira santarosai serovar Shermani str. LT 821 TaxID=758847 RepID=K8XYY1_9LEPT|nr:hypothetical protein LSS_11135 [Leptospira santarosai serovar Shermani str. LT 821]